MKILWMQETGIHVTVLNEHTGAVMATRIFDTYIEKEDQGMIRFLNILQEGRIVIFTTMVSFIRDCFFQLFQCASDIFSSATLQITFFVNQDIKDVHWCGNRCPYFHNEITQV